MLAIETANIVSSGTSFSRHRAGSLHHQKNAERQQEEKETDHYNRHEPMIHAMQIAEQLLEEQHQLQQDRSSLKQSIHLLYNEAHKAKRGFEGRSSKQLYVFFCSFHRKNSDKILLTLPTGAWKEAERSDS